MINIYGGKVVVRTPATSANLGPGFDSLGLALDLCDEVEVEITQTPGLVVEVKGEGEGELDAGEGHLVVRALRAAFDAFTVRQPAGIRMVCRNRIPHGRGLGSSSAAICAGILAARALAHPEHAGSQETRRDRGSKLSDDFALALATEIEGHPDNVAPCIAGGLTVAWIEQPGVPRMVKLVPHADVRPVALIPRHRLSTEVARGLLPAQVPHADASANAGRAALLVAALTGRPERELLMAATEDRLHQGYRAPAMPETAELVERLRGAGVPAVVSGAGPTVLAFSTADTQDLIAPEVGTDWHIQPLDVETRGARVAFPETR
ncbi:homoserine kinase [Planomonospora venezuelensis]|uniref:Homoserine kinase n=1 Tax=Planomonospora venezuelensis TaxID=1999 RepID=A0A841D6H4_PLAVE|nr:homoserine kinase [Planomonospora venezuelensis]MBB5965480.1 homoserine kinase [Planomonospora venezuelensis]GIN03389.1 homoserine kinase [Planomonospora venezuelensis]